MHSIPKRQMAATVWPLVLTLGACGYTASGPTQTSDGRAAAVQDATPLPCDGYYVPTNWAARPLVKALQDISGEMIPRATFSGVPKGQDLAVCVRLAAEHKGPSMDSLAQVMSVLAQLDHVPRKYRVEMRVWDHALDRVAMRRRFSVGGAQTRYFTLGQNVGWSDDHPFWIGVGVRSDASSTVAKDGLSLVWYAANPSIRRDIHKGPRQARYTIPCIQGGVTTMGLMDGHSRAYTVTVNILVAGETTRARH